MACNQQPDGRWHFLVEFRGLIYTKGAGTARYQWGRGGGDIRSDVRTYTVDKALAVGESFYPATDRISGSTDSPTDTVIDRLHILAPVPKGLADLEMTAKICP